VKEENLWKVSFKGTDITRVKFTEKVIWGKNPKERFKLIDEVYLEQSLFPLLIGMRSLKRMKKKKKYLKEYSWSG
jgi:hypothetical protein